MRNWNLKAVTGFILSALGQMMVLSSGASAEQVPSNGTRGGTSERRDNRVAPAAFIQLSATLSTAGREELGGVFFLRRSLGSAR